MYRLTAAAEGPGGWALPWPGWAEFGIGSGLSRACSEPRTRGGPAGGADVGQERRSWWAPVFARRRRNGSDRHTSPALVAAPAGPVAAPPLPALSAPPSSPRPPVPPPRRPHDEPPDRDRTGEEPIDLDPAAATTADVPAGGTPALDSARPGGVVPVVAAAHGPLRPPWLPVPDVTRPPGPVLEPDPAAAADTVPQMLAPDRSRGGARGAGRRGAVRDTANAPAGWPVRPETSAGDPEPDEHAGTAAVRPPRRPRRPLPVAPAAAASSSATAGALLARLGEPGVTGAVSTGALLWAALAMEARTGAGGAVTVIPTFARSAGAAIYSLSQAFGVMALVWAWWSTLIGLVMSARPPWTGFPTWKVLERTHRGSGITVVVLIATHAGLLVFDQIGDNPISAFVVGFPSPVPGRPSVPIGILAFYVALILGMSYYLRTRIGPRRWRKAHRFVVLVYVLGVWHALGMGSDLHPGSWPWILVWLAQPPLAVALLRRWTQPMRASERITRPWARAATAPAAEPAARSRPAVAAVAAAGAGTSAARRPVAAARAALPAGAGDRTDPQLTYVRRVEAAHRAHLLDQLAMVSDPDLLAAAGAAIAARGADLQTTPDEPAVPRRSAPSGAR